jgi:uncharacterized protein
MKRNEIIQLLHHDKEQDKEMYQIIQMGVLGSIAKNLMTADSDIDVVVELKKPDLFILIGIKQDLEEQLHKPVDIVRYRDQMNAFLKQRIDQEAVFV